MSRLRLKEDSDSIAEYERCHEEVWPEIIWSIRESGIEDLEIYRVGGEWLRTERIFKLEGAREEV